jgi:hypothetical protein
MKMNKHVSYFFVAILLMATQSFARSSSTKEVRDKYRSSVDTYATKEATGPRAAGFLSIYPLDAFIGTLALEGGVHATEHFSLGLQGSLSELRSKKDGFRGYSFGAVSYYYVRDNLRSGPYLKGSIDQGFLNIKGSKDQNNADVRYEEPASGDVNYNQFKFLFGYHWMMHENINLDLGTGINYLVADADIRRNTTVKVGGYRTKISNDKFAGFVPSIELSLGVALLR